MLFIRNCSSINTPEIISMGAYSVSLGQFKRFRHFKPQYEIPSVLIQKWKTKWNFKLSGCRYLFVAWNCPGKALNSSLWPIYTMVDFTLTHVLDKT